MDDRSTKINQAKEKLRAFKSDNSKAVLTNLMDKIEGPSSYDQLKSEKLNQIGKSPTKYESDRPSEIVSASDGNSHYEARIQSLESQLESKQLVIKSLTKEKADLLLKLDSYSNAEGSNVQIEEYKRLLEERDEVIRQQRVYITKLETDIEDSPELKLFQKKYNDSSAKVKELLSALSLSSDDNKRLVKAMAGMKRELETMKETNLNLHQELEELQSVAQTTQIPQSIQTNSEDGLSEVETERTEAFSQNFVSPTSPHLLDQLQAQWQSEKERNHELSLRVRDLETILNVNGRKIEDHPQYQLQLDYNQKLEKKFIELSNERAELMDQLFNETQRNTQLIKQTEEIPNLILQYHAERKKLKEREVERDNLISEMMQVQKDLKQQIAELKGVPLDSTKIEQKVAHFKTVESKNDVDFTNLCGLCKDHEILVI